MNKKILAIGSIIACIIILLASLSPVVGYNSARSSVGNSPLFTVRTNRAINEESVSLTCDYVGKGNIFQIPARDSKTVQIQKMIDTIKSMDDKTFLKFVVLVAERYKQPLTDIEVGLEEILAVFYLIRETPYKSFVPNNLRGEEFNLSEFTLDNTLKCKILLILLILGEIVFAIFIILYGLILTIKGGCHTVYLFDPDCTWSATGCICK